MKQFAVPLSKLTHKFILASIACLLFIWGLGPWLAIDGVVLLPNLAAKLTPTLLLALAWGGYFFWKLLKRNDQQSNLEKPLLIERLRLAYSPLKKQGKNKPWIFLLGSEHCGKASLLTQSNLVLQSCLSTEQLIKDTPLVDFYTSAQSIYVDISANKPEIWQQLLPLIGKKRHQAPIDKLLVVLDAATLTQQGDEQQQHNLSSLSTQLQAIAIENRSVSLLLIINHCDRIRGFKEYFSHYDSDALKKPMGFTIPSSIDSHALPSYIEKKLQQLVGNISKQVIWHLHHEQNLNKRYLIQDFPIQLEQFTHKLTTQFEQLVVSSAIQLDGLYFVSSEQQGQTIDLTAATTEQLLSTQHNEAASKTKTQQKAYFIHALFEKIDQQTTIGQGTRYIWRRLLAFPIAAALIIMATWFWHHQYQQNVAILTAANNSLNSIPRVTSANMDLPQINQLHTLKQTLIALQKQPVSTHHFSGLNQANRVRKQTKQAYHQLLQNVFQPYLLNILTSTIERGIHNNKSALYNALKVYMMLNNRQHFDANVIVYWFREFWEKRYPQQNALQQELIQYLNNLIALKSFNWPIQPGLIRQAQQSLQQLPFAQLVFLELEGRKPTKQIPIVAKNMLLPQINFKQARVSAFYSAKDFNQIFNQSIPRLVKQLVNGNWVLGKHAASLTQQDSIDPIIKQVRVRYLAAYSMQWAQAIDHIKLQQTANIKQIHQQINLLIANDSAFIQLLKIIVGNATLVDKLSSHQFNQNKTIAYLQNYLLKKQNYQKIALKLNHLNNYLSSITSASSPVKAAYQAAVNRFNNQGADDTITQLLLLAKQSPQPMQNWLNTIAIGAWHAILVNSRRYLNSAWTLTVLPEYNESLRNKFPLFSGATADISLPAFNSFFKPDGIINIFFNYFLKPFINLNKKYWTWKKLDGLSIGIPQAKLDAFIRASMIQQMFYSNGGHSASVKFRLVPVKLSSQAGAFSLNLGGQLIEFLPDTVKSSSQLTWPAQNNTIKIQFISKDGKVFHFKQSGTWAWLRLLDMSLLKTTANTKIYIVTFQLDNYQAQYKLVAGNIVNPYIPGLLSAFRAPKTL